MLSSRSACPPITSLLCRAAHQPMPRQARYEDSYWGRFAQGVELSLCRIPLFATPLSHRRQEAPYVRQGHELCIGAGGRRPSTDTAPAMPLSLRRSPQEPRSLVAKAPGTPSLQVSTHNERVTPCATRGYKFVTPPVTNWRRGLDAAMTRNPLPCNAI